MGYGIRSMGVWSGWADILGRTGIGLVDYERMRDVIYTQTFYCLTHIVKAPFFCFNAKGKCVRRKMITFKLMRLLDTQRMVGNTNTRMTAATNCDHIKLSSPRLHVPQAHHPTTSLQPRIRIEQSRPRTKDKNMPPQGSKEDSEKQDAARQAVDILHEISTILVRTNQTTAVVESKQSIPQGISIQKISLTCAKKKHESSKSKLILLTCRTVISTAGHSPSASPWWRTA